MAGAAKCFRQRIKQACAFRSHWIPSRDNVAWSFTPAEPPPFLCELLLKDFADRPRGKSASQLRASHSAFVAASVGIEKPESSAGPPFVAVMQSTETAARTASSIASDIGTSGGTSRLGCSDGYAASTMWACGSLTSLGAQYSDPCRRSWVSNGGPPSGPPRVGRVGRLPGASPDDSDGHKPARSGEALIGIEAGYLGVCAGHPFVEPLPWIDDERGNGPNGDMWATADESRVYIIGLYQRACAHSDSVVDNVAIDAVATVPVVARIGGRRLSVRCWRGS